MASSAAKSGGGGSGGRKGVADTALSDFADYVEKQQQLRNRGASAAATAAAKIDDHEDELDIIEQLGLGEDSAVNVKLKDLFLDKEENSMEKLKEIIVGLMEEGRGEALFDVGFENNGDPMGLTKEEYEMALKRVTGVAHTLKSSITILLTKNLGIEGEAPGDGKGCSSKILIRRKPDVIEELLEIRIAVVGNGRKRSVHIIMVGVIMLRFLQSTLGSLRY